MSEIIAIVRMTYASANNLDCRLMHLRDLRA